MSKDTPDLTPTGAPTSGTGSPASYDAPVPASYDDHPSGGGDLVLEPLRPSLAVRLGAEAVGSYLVVFVGLGVMLYSVLFGTGVLGVALAFGLALLGAAVAFGHISGGHFNPAVTIGAAIAGRTPWRDVVPYWLAQLVGAILAAATLFLTVPASLPGLLGAESSVRTFFTGTANGYGEHSQLARVSQGEHAFDLVPALLIEIVATALLVGVVLAATSRQVHHALAPVAMGLTYAVLLLLAGPVTNGGLNPARSTAAAIFSESWALGQLWLFWVAPVVGAALAGLANRAFASETIEDNLLEEDDLLVEEEDVAVERPHD
jgi:aquaporin Z